MSQLLILPRSRITVVVAQLCIMLAGCGNYDKSVACRWGDNYPILIMDLLLLDFSSFFFGSFIWGCALVVLSAFLDMRRCSGIPRTCESGFWPEKEKAPLAAEEVGMTLATSTRNR